MSKEPIRETDSSTKQVSIFDKFSYLAVLTVSFLLPIFILPLWGTPIDISKSFLVSFGVMITLISWLISRIRGEGFHVSKNPIYLGLVAFLLTYFISAFFSGTVSSSLFGLGYEKLTAFFILTLSLLLFFTSISFTKREKQLKLYIAIFASFFILFVFQVIHIAYGDITGGYFLPWDIFQNGAANTLGKWNDLGVFFGFITVLSLGFLEIFDRRLLPNLARGMLVLSVGGLIIINFQLSWIIVSIFSAGMLAYSLVLGSDKDETGGNKNRLKLRASAVVLVIALFFIVFGGERGRTDIFGGERGRINSSLNDLSEDMSISALEIRPSFDSTNMVLSGVLSDNPIVGVGANNFSYAWLAYRPLDVNETIFWNNNFNEGFSIAQTIIVNGGTITIVGLMALLASILFVFYKAIKFKYEDSGGRHLVFLSMTLVLYLWSNMFVYTSGVAVLGITFIMTGVLIGSLSREGVFPEFNISTLKKSKYSLALSAVFMVVLLLTLIGTYSVVTKAWANTNYWRGLSHLRTGDIDKAIDAIDGAASMAKSDVYLRTLAELNMSKLNFEIRNPDLTEDQLGVIFRERFNRAVELGAEAISKNNLNILNYLSLGNTYEAIIPFGVDGAYDLAKSIYNQGGDIVPTSPLIPIGLARVEFSQRNNDEAVLAVNKALELKRDFADAMFLLAQIESERGNLPEAIKRAEEVGTILPDNVGVWFQIGFLKYKIGDYSGARDALLATLKINRDYSNAKYFLGLSYDRLNVNDEAIRLFREIAETNPGNTEVQAIISNLEAGKNALSGLSGSEEVNIENIE